MRWKTFINLTNKNLCFTEDMPDAKDSIFEPRASNWMPNALLKLGISFNKEEMDMEDFLAKVKKTWSEINRIDYRTQTYFEIYKSLLEIFVWIRHQNHWEEKKNTRKSNQFNKWEKIYKKSIVKPSKATELSTWKWLQKVFSA